MRYSDNSSIDNKKSTCKKCVKFTRVENTILFVERPERADNCPVVDKTKISKMRQIFTRIKLYVLLTARRSRQFLNKWQKEHLQKCVKLTRAQNALFAERPKRADNLKTIKREHPQKCTKSSRGEMPHSVMQPKQADNSSICDKKNI